MAGAAASKVVFACLLAIPDGSQQIAPCGLVMSPLALITHGPGVCFAVCVMALVLYSKVSASKIWPCNKMRVKPGIVTHIDPHIKIRPPTYLVTRIERLLTPILVRFPIRTILACIHNVTPLIDCNPTVIHAINAHAFRHITLSHKIHRTPTRICLVIGNIGLYTAMWREQIGEK
jgi:hypothetical protein